MSMRKVATFALALGLAGCSANSTSPAADLQPIILGQGSSGVGMSEVPQPTVTEQASDSLEPRPSAPTYARDRYAEIDIDDQSGDGSSISIDEIEISGGNSFLVIYDSTGLVIVSALVTAQSQPVTIKLDYPLESSQELEAALYLDDGDGVFRLADDFPILDDEEELVHEDFYYRLTPND
jgi:hypothetical protein